MAPESPEVPERTGAAPPMDDRDLEELMEYRVAERAYDRVVKRLKFLAWIVGVALAVVGGVGAYKLDDMNNLLNTKMREIGKSFDETAREILIHRVEIEDAMAAHRARVYDFDALERRARLDRPCSPRPTWEQVESWFRKYGVDEPPKREVAIVVGAVRRYFICDRQPLSAVLENPSVQKDLDDLYRRILGREPDVIGRVKWGWRLQHRYPPKVVEQMIRASDEARER